MPSGPVGPDFPVSYHPHAYTGVIAMSWETPAATDYRFGFEITMYMYHR